MTPDGAGAGAGEELRVPTRIGSGKPKAKAGSGSQQAKQGAKSSEDEEDEGTGELSSLSNILTKDERRNLTAEQKESWRAKAADLTTRRKDFHGIVTYTFDGVFSWQMYGSAEAVDETGASYTEYLMRCQWGPDFEHLHPWIVAHRYKEFDYLDQQLKRRFSSMEANMPLLPKKELFRSLDSSVVASRRAVLEEYMSKILVSMPTLLRSSTLNDFLDISNRITVIKLKLRTQSTLSSTQTKGEGGGAGAGAGADDILAWGLAQPKTSAVTGNSKYGIEDPLCYEAPPPACRSFGDMTEGPEAIKTPPSEPDEPLYWTLDAAEQARETKQAPSLDEDELGHMEVDIRALAQVLKKSDHKILTLPESRFRLKFRAVSRRWPGLRATAVVGMGVDFTLIPRAMQAEEDLLGVLNEFRNVETARALSRGPL